jgi:hypothetical protein
MILLYPSGTITKPPLLSSCAPIEKFRILQLEDPITEVCTLGCFKAKASLLAALLTAQRILLHH